MPVPVSSARSSSSAFSARSPARLLRVVCLVSAGLLLGSCADQPLAPAAPGQFALLIVGGNQQTAPAGTELPLPLKVRATRPNGSPLPDIVVNFRVTSGGGSVYAGSAITDRDGSASDYWTLGPVTSAPQTLEVRAVTASGEKEIFGVFTATATPAPMRIGQTIVAAGYVGGFACGLIVGGEAYCWGDNSTGQLGDGTTTQRLVPTATAGGLSFFSIAAGDWHTCGLTNSGAAYCWGANSLGQLGDGTTSPRLIPAAVVGGLKFVSFTAGGSHTCALTSDGKAYCWGENNLGQGGDGTTISHKEPIPVAGGLRFLALSAGEKHTCGLVATGAAYCWGWNAYGQLGDGSASYFSPTPSPVAGGLRFTTLTAGRITGHQTCGMVSGGNGYCWGYNVDGQLGDGGRTNRPVPTPIAGGMSFLSMAAGGSHTCGIVTSGGAYCWGSNYEGELGNGVSWSPPIPTPGLVLGGLSFSALSAGELTTCGLTTAGAAYCWGNNGWGEIGDGTKTARPVPTAVAGGLTFLLGT